MGNGVMPSGARPIFFFMSSQLWLSQARFDQKWTSEQYPNIPNLSMNIPLSQFERGNIPGKITNTVFCQIEAPGAIARLNSQVLT